MSHIVTIESQVRDEVAAALACRRLKLPAPVRGRFELFTSVQTGLGVELPKWRYPVVCDTDSGQLHFDNFEGRWGDRVHLEKFLQMYAVEKSKLESRKAGHTVTEQSLPNGSIKLVVQVGGQS
jgi:hypothetical protein